MIAYLTSNIGGINRQDGKLTPSALNPANGLTDSLRSHWKDSMDLLVISSDPNALAMNDGMAELFPAAFGMSGLPIHKIDVCDSRREDLAKHLSEYDIVILSGGHVPTENAFFQRIRLKEALDGFDGILIGISAGTMNSARTVYAQPELDGESTDETFQRFLPGLGLTDCMVLPHYHEVKNLLLDEKRLFEDITYPDSFGREFYALPDGSYLKIENGTTVLFGEAYLLKDGELRQICENGKSIVLENK